MCTRLKPAHQQRNNTQLIFVYREETEREKKKRTEIHALYFVHHVVFCLWVFNMHTVNHRLDSFLFTNTSSSASISTVILRLLDQHKKWLNLTFIDIRSMDCVQYFAWSIQARIANTSQFDCLLWIRLKFLKVYHFLNSFTVSNGNKSIFSCFNGSQVSSTHGTCTKLNFHNIAIEMRYFIWFDIQCQNNEKKKQTASKMNCFLDFEQHWFYFLCEKHLKNYMTNHANLFTHVIMSKCSVNFFLVQRI